MIFTQASAFSNKLFQTQNTSVKLQFRDCIEGQTLHVWTSNLPRDHHAYSGTLRNNQNLFEIILNTENIIQVLDNIPTNLFSKKEKRLEMKSWNTFTKEHTNSLQRL